MSEKKVSAIIIVEVAGRPAEHIKEALKNHVEQLKFDKNIEVISVEIREPKRIEIEEEMYSCFAEVEIKVTNFTKLLEIIFDYMPSSIQILEPEELNFNLNDATAFTNDLAGRLHKYDEIAKIAQMQTQQILAKFQQDQVLMSEKLKECVKENLDNAEIKKDKMKKKSCKKKTKSKS
ncbi:MAG: hypothetical protein ACOYT4_05300 [Nanoarchaeota archaeon]